MNTPRTRTERAIILRSIDYGDKDRIITLLMSAEGKRTAIAKGGKVSKKRFAGALELFRLCDVTYSEGSRKDTMAILKESTVVEDFRHIEASFDKIAVGSYATELTRELIHDGEGQGPVLTSLVDFYRRLDGQEEHAARLEADLQTFILQLLKLSGYAPQLTHCAQCGLAVDSGQRLLFSRRGEGVICQRCREPGQATLDTSATIVLTLSELSQGYPTAQSEPIPVAHLRQGRQLVFALVRAVLPRELRSYSTLKMVLP
ncbi:MAG: DNA repair protein RecO [Myxococcota bacterium]